MQAVGESKRLKAGVKHDGRKMAEGERVKARQEDKGNRQSGETRKNGERKCEIKWKMKWLALGKGAVGH
jgi:hypothetical protein